MAGTCGGDLIVLDRIPADLVPLRGDHFQRPRHQVVAPSSARLFGSDPRRPYLLGALYIFDPETGARQRLLGR